VYGFRCEHKNSFFPKSKYLNVWINFLCSGTPQPQIVWYFDNAAITQNTERLHIFSNGTLVVENPLIEDTGLYKCEASNYLGSVSSIANVQVYGKCMFFYNIPFLLN
jgi:hypothetical protein